MYYLACRALLYTVVAGQYRYSHAQPAQVTDGRRKVSSKCANVRTIDVSIGHDDDVVIAQFSMLYSSRPIPQPKAVIKVPTSCDENHLVEACFLDVQNLAFERQNGLVLRLRPCLAEPPAESPSTR